MSRKEEIENIIVGSCLNDRSKVRDCALLTSDTMTRVNGELWGIISTTTAERPIDEIIELYGILSPETIIHALDIAYFDDIEARKNHYNLNAHIHLLLGHAADYTDIQLSDYVSRYLQLCYPTIEIPRCAC